MNGCQQNRTVAALLGSAVGGLMGRCSVAGLRRLVASINRYLGEEPADLAETIGGARVTAAP